MTRDNGHTHGARSADPALAELERQIAETREQLGETVEQLAAKADVPARAKAKAQETAERLRDKAAKAEDRVRQSAAELKSHLPGSGAGSTDGLAAQAAMEPGPAPAGGSSSGAHLAEIGHDAVARTGARLSRVTQDQWRHVYLPAAAVTLTAGVVITLAWARHRSTGTSC